MTSLQHMPSERVTQSDGRVTDAAAISACRCLAGSLQARGLQHSAVDGAADWDCDSEIVAATFLQDKAANRIVA